MICFIALIVFAILGIFSAYYRRLAKEACDCVFRRLTFRRCSSNLDERLKSSITGKLMQKNIWLANKVYKNFELLSWIFVILMIASLFYSAYGLYNYVQYGNCNGQDGGICIYNNINKVKCGNEYCTIENCKCAQDKCTCQEEVCENETTR